MRTLFSPLHEFLKKGDLVLLSLCLLTSGFGVALIFSATRYNQNNRPVVIQCVAILLGVAVYLLCTFVDFQLFVEKNWKWLFGGSVFFLLLLLTPLGNDHNSGNLNWLDIPGFPLEIQPNEIIKIPFILLLSLQITKIQDRGQSISSLPSLVQIGGHAAFMLALIAGICGDMGMCVVYLFIFAVMAWGAGVKKRWFLLAGSALVIGFAVLWIFILPNTAAWDSLYLVKRFRVLFDHSYDSLGVGWQQSRSLLAIGSGGIFGQGYMQGTQTQSSESYSLPYRWTDFIFSVCGEELGLIGCLAVIALLTAIIIRVLLVARNAQVPLHCYVCVGMAAMLIYQTVINIGMCLFVMPTIGVTLPFFSYGGSSLLTLYAAMGVVSGIKKRSPVVRRPGRPLG